MTEEDVLGKHFVMWHWMPGNTDGAVPPGKWRCTCGFQCAFSATAIKHQADELRKARSVKPWDEGWTYGRIVERNADGDPVKAEWIAPEDLVASRDAELIEATS